MSRKLCIVLLVAFCCALLGGKCGGGDGGGGGGSIESESPDPRCTALPSSFPPGFDFVPGADSLIWVANFSPPALVPFDVSAEPPVHSGSTETFPLPFDSDGDGREEGSATLPISPLFDDIHIVSPELALVRIGETSCEIARSDNAQFC